MGVVIFASDAKGTSSVASTIQELHSKNIPYFAMVSSNTQLQYPTMGLDQFLIYSNCKIDSQKYPATSLGLYLPFKPEWLIVQRERWEPESSIILEFKQTYESKIGLIEPNAQLVNNAETVLETYSRNRYVPYIDVFFDHSTHIANQRKIAGFKGNSIIVGNPKYDKNLDVPRITIDSLKNYYSVDEEKPKILLYSLINGNRSSIFDRFKEIVQEKQETHQIFYKPYPGEPFDPKFRKDYNPQFVLKNVTPILEESHIWGMFNICDIHIGCISSIFHAPLLLGKTIIDLSESIGFREDCLDKTRVLSNDGVGIEQSLSMWMRSFNFKEKSQLEELLPDSLFETIKENNDKFWNHSDSYLSLFDDFNDGKASKRIVQFIENDIRQ